MKHFIISFFLIIFFQSSFSQVIVVNEVFNGTSQKTDWVELLVVQNNLDLRGYQVRDFSSGGVPQTPLRFSNNPYWRGIHSGTLIVITGDTSLYTEDTSKSDFVIQLRFKTYDTTYFRGVQFDIAVSSDAVQVKNPAPDSSHLHGIAWGANNVNSLPSPRAWISGQLATGSSCYFSKPTIMLYSDFGVNAYLHKDTSGGTRGRPNDSVSNGGNYLYILQLRAIIGIQSNNKIVKEFHLYQNYPNPFNPSTRIEFDILKSAYVTLEIYNILGSIVASPVLQQLSAGSYTINFFAFDLSSGVYYYKLTAREPDGKTFTNAKTMLLIK